MKGMETTGWQGRAGLNFLDSSVLFEVLLINVINFNGPHHPIDSVDK